MKLSIFSMNRAPEEAQNAPPHAPPGGPNEPQEEPKTQPRVGGTPVLSIQELRQRVLDRVFVVGSVLSVLALLAKLPQIIENAWWGMLGLYSLAVALLLFFTVRRDYSYTLRGIIASATMFAVGLGVLVNEGLYGSGRVFLLTAALVTTMLAGERSRIGSTILAIGSIFVVGGLMVSGLLAVPHLSVDGGNSSLEAWLTAGMSFTLVTVTLVSSFSILLNGLENSVNSQTALMTELRRERAALEQRVQTRTEALERRLLQIRAAAEITRTISREFDIQVLLQQVCELVQERFNLYYVGIFLIEGEEEALPGASTRPSNAARFAVLAAGTGEPGRQMINERHRLLVGSDSMIGWATANRQARIALDTGKEAARFNNPYLPRTRSELALPIMGGQERRSSAQSRPASQAARSAQSSQPVWGQPRVEAEADKDGGPRNGQASPGGSEYGRVLGAMTIQSDQEAAFDQDDIIVLQGIADGLANAIENARLFAATQASLEEVSTLHRQYLQSAWTETVRRQGALAYTYQPDGAAPSSADSDPPERPAAEPLTVPIQLRDQIIGSLVLEPAQGGAAWTVEQQQLAAAVAAQAALALENARLLEETRQRAEQERATSAITGKLWSSSDLDQILRTVLTSLAGTLNANEGWVEIWPGGETPSNTLPYPASGTPIKEAGDVDG